MIFIIAIGKISVFLGECDKKAGDERARVEMIYSRERLNILNIVDSQAFKA
jgi:hypothetical protein